MVKLFGSQEAEHFKYLWRSGEKVKEMPHWRKAVIKGKREGQKSLNASEEQGEKNSEGP